MTLLQDLQAALPALGIILPKGSSLQTGTLSTNLNIQGPLGVFRVSTAQAPS
jgi:hypothetical protein